MSALFPWSSAATPLGDRVDTLMISLTVLVSLVAGTVIVLICVFCIRYRHDRRVERRAKGATQVQRSNRRIEMAWTIT